MQTRVSDDISFAHDAKQGVVILTWDNKDEKRFDEVIKAMGELIGGGWDIASHTTVVVGTQIVQTVIMVLRP